MKIAFPLTFIFIREICISRKKRIVCGVDHIHVQCGVARIVKLLFVFERHPWEGVILLGRLSISLLWGSQHHPRLPLIGVSLKPWLWRDLGSCSFQLIATPKDALKVLLMKYQWALMDVLMRRNCWQSSIIRESANTFKAPLAIVLFTFTFSIACQTHQLVLRFAIHNRNSFFYLLIFVLSLWYYRICFLFIYNCPCWMINLLPV